MYRNRQADQKNKIKVPGINPLTYWHLIFDKKAKTIQWKKENTFNTYCWSNWMSAGRTMQTDSCLLHCKKLKSRGNQRPQHKIGYTTSNRGKWKITLDTLVEETTSWTEYQWLKHYNQYFRNGTSRNELLHNRTISSPTLHLRVVKYHIYIYMSFISNGRTNSYNYPGNQFGGFSENWE